MTQSTGRRPDYSVGALDKDSGVRQPRVGAAWTNDDGTISLKLDPFVVLNGGRDLVVTLFPSTEEIAAAGSDSVNQARTRARAHHRQRDLGLGPPRGGRRGAGGGADFDDEIPF